MILLLILLVPTGVLLFVPARESGTPLPSSHSPSRSSSPSKERSTPNGENSVTKVKLNVVPPLAALTTYRAHMILLTAICILAVDFRIFPRSLAKCETFGVSVVRNVLTDYSTSCSLTLHRWTLVLVPSFFLKV